MNHNKPDWNISAGNLITVFLILFLAWLLLRWLRSFLEHISITHPRMRFLLRQVEPPVRILVWFTAILTCAGLLAPSRDAFVAAMGSLAIAVALGAQDLIKNLIGGLVIVADRPYQTGDRVKIGDAYGEIQHIGLRSTKLMTPDDTLVTVPNAEILSRFAHNANAGVPECLVCTQLFLPTGADADLAVQIAREAAISSPFTHLGRRIFVKLEDSFTEEPFLTLTVKAYVYDHRYESAMQTDIARRTKREFAASGLLDAWRKE